MFKQKDPASADSAQQPNVNRQTLSKAELMTKIQGNMDSLLKGMRAGPYREDGVIKGYKIFALSKENLLYDLGIRPGDVILRINGHPIDSTEKLFNLWQKLPQESKAMIDVQRGNSTATLDYTFTN